MLLLTLLRSDDGLDLELVLTGSDPGITLG